MEIVFINFPIDFVLDFQIDFVIDFLIDFVIEFVIDFFWPQCVTLTPDLSWKWSLVESFCDFAERILTLFLGEYEDGHEQEEEYG